MLSELQKSFPECLDVTLEKAKVLGCLYKFEEAEAEGEMLQLQKAQKGDTDENDYLRIIYSKTASLFEAASVSAAISVGASEAYVQAARNYAVSLGIAFQIQDDILDITSSLEVLGKMTGSDEKNNKVTYILDCDL